MQSAVILGDFTPMSLSKEIPQATLLEETANIFALTQCAIRRPESQAAADRISAEARKLVQRYGVSPAYIGQREVNTMLNVKVTAGEDCSYPSVIPRPLQEPHGLPIDQRMEKFREAASRLLEEHYADCKQAPDDLIHVTSTGYLSPSPVQQFVTRQHWNNIIVTHSYHMGCLWRIFRGEDRPWSHENLVCPATP